MSSTEIIRLIFMGIAAYFIGNINPAIIIGKLKGIDIRKEGSGNAGMTNSIRVMGLGAGIAVFVIDVLKAFIAVKLGLSFCGAAGAMAAFAGVVLGHCFPAFYHFKGGKGVAVGLALAFAAGWQVGVSVLMAFAVTVAISRKVSLASLAAAAAGMLTVWFFNPDRRYCWMVMAAAIVIILRHSANIERLTQGKEADFHFADEKKSREEKP